MNEQILQETIKELALKITNLEIENAQLKAMLSQNVNNEEKPVMPNMEKGDD